jgi:alanine racemase
VTVTSHVNESRDLKEGDEVGYGGTWEAPGPCVVVVVPMGYGDGLPTTIHTEAGKEIHTVREHAYALVGEAPLQSKALFVGSPSMDMVTLLLPKDASAEHRKEGVKVTIIGGELTLDKFAELQQSKTSATLARRPNRVKVVFEPGAAGERPATAPVPSPNHWGGARAD